MNFREFIKKIHPVRHPTTLRFQPTKFKNGRIDWRSVPLGTVIICTDWSGEEYRGRLVAVHPRTLELAIPGCTRPFYCLRSEVTRIG